MEHNPAERPSSTTRALGTRLDGITDLESAVRAVSEHPGPVEVPSGAGQLVGRHLGSVPQRQVGEALRGAGADPLMLRAEISIDEDIPDEGVIAVLDDHLSLAAGVGAEYLVVPRTGVGGRGRSEERLFSMLAALAEAASARDHWWALLQLTHVLCVEGACIALLMASKPWQQVQGWLR